MNERFSDEHLGRILADIGDHLVLPDAEAGSDRDVPTIRSRWSPVWMAAAAAAIVVIVGVGAGAPPVRESVAGWLGIGSTEVQLVVVAPNDPSSLPRLRDGARPVDATEAVRLLGGRVPDFSETALGPPQSVAQPIEGGVIFAWVEGDTTLWIHPSEVRPAELLRKTGDDGVSVRDIPDLGDGGALLVLGEHLLDTPSRRLSASNVLIWTDGRDELRLESDLGDTAMIAIARSLAR